MKNFPLYKCHKTVEAFKIHSITAQALGTAAGEIVPPTMVMVGVNEDGSPRLMPSAQKTEYVLRDNSGDFEIVVDEDFIERHGVHTSGYLVRYDNGHLSFSPAEAFEDGYTIATEKRVIVIRLGNDRWTPKLEDLQAVMEMFMGATADPEGAVVAVNHAVRLETDQVLRTETENFYVCSIDNKQDFKTLLNSAPREAKEPPVGTPHWMDVVVRPAGFDGPTGHDGRTIWVNNEKSALRAVRGRSVRSVRLSGVTRAELYPDLESTLENATYTYEGMHGPIVWEEE